MHRVPKARVETEFLGDDPHENHEDHPGRRKQNLTCMTDVVVLEEIAQGFIGISWPRRHRKQATLPIHRKFCFIFNSVLSKRPNIRCQIKPEHGEYRNSSWYKNRLVWQEHLSRERKGSCLPKGCQQPKTPLTAVAAKI